MKRLKLKTLAIFIEYHWWRVDCLRNKNRHENSEITRNREDFHKFRAEQLMVLYEIYSGLRDYCGNIVA